MWWRCWYQAYRSLSSRVTASHLSCPARLAVPSTWKAAHGWEPCANSWRVWRLPSKLAVRSTGMQLCQPRWCGRPLRRGQKSWQRMCERCGCASASGEVGCCQASRKALRRTLANNSWTLYRVRYDCAFKWQKGRQKFTLETYCEWLRAMRCELAAPCCLRVLD